MKNALEVPRSYYTMKERRQRLDLAMAFDDWCNERHNYRPFISNSLSCWSLRTSLIVAR